jgi:hypothetical protein
MFIFLLLFSLESNAFIESIHEDKKMDEKELQNKKEGESRTN